MTIRVLHVDDNAFDRELVRNALESESGNFQVIEAKSRREFEQRLGQGGFDIVVSDFNILGFDGLQVLDAVAASAPLTPVVIVTGTGTEEIAVEALKRGAADYVIKHISHIQKLPQTIAAVLENCRLKQENERTWQAIRSSEERFRALAQNAPVGIFETDAAGAYVFVNERWAAIVGQAGRVVLGGNWLQTVHPEDRAAVAAAWREVSDQGAEFEAEYRVDSSTAGTRWVWNQATPLHDAQTQVCGYIGTLADITERKLMVEALAQAKLAAEAGSRAKSVFLSNMSHELRTPLSGIMGMLNLSLSCNLGSETAEWLGLAKKAGHSILKIFDDILDLSSIENNAMTLVTRRYSPAEMLRGLTKRFELRAREKGLELTVRLAPDLPAVVLGDVRRLEQVLSNLLDNALKFTQLGEIVIEAGLEEQQPFPTLRFAIQDTGCGVAPENIERLFQPFTQIDDSLAKQFQGTGLGLVIGKKLVEMMEGRIEVQSTARQGSVFTVHLPLRLPQGKAELRAPSQVPGLRPLRILLVEDDMLNQTYIAAMLINHGHTVVTAADGVQALDILRRDTFELILLDVQLPVKSGIEVLHELRSWEKKRSCRYPTKVIGVTAYAMKGDHERFLAAGMDDCVHKPFEFEELLACMAKVLGQ